ncbi:MAG: hypothetical protein ABIV93_03280 [Byssovorax sp.]
MAFGACAGSLDNKDEFLDAGFTTAASSGTGVDACGNVEATILTAKCGGSGCHGVMAPQNDLDLESPGVAARVVGVPAQLCQGTLADPSSPETSVLYTKLFVDTTCGAQMPLARPELSQKDKECLKTWIAKQTSGTSTSASTGSGSGGAGGAGGAGATGSQSSSGTGT